MRTDFQRTWNDQAMVILYDGHTVAAVGTCELDPDCINDMLIEMEDEHGVSVLEANDTAMSDAEYIYLEVSTEVDMAIDNGETLLCPQ